MKPVDLAFEEAAVLPIPVTTAWIIVSKAKLQRGARVFINGSSGAVGRALIGILRPLGTQITGRTRSSDVGQSERLGLAQALDYTKPIPDSLRETFDLVFDASGTLAPGEANMLRKRGGLIVDIVTLFPRLWRAVIFRDHVMVSFNGDRKYLEPAVGAALANQVRLSIGSVVPWREVSLITDL